MTDNIRRSRSQSPEHADREHRIEGREIQDQSRRPLSSREITSTPEAREYQSISLQDWLRQQSERHGIQIFGLNDPEMPDRRNQQVDQQASSSRDSHSEAEDLRQDQQQVMPQRASLVHMLEMLNSPPPRLPRRSFSVHEARQQLDQFRQDVLLIHSYSDSDLLRSNAKMERNYEKLQIIKEWKDKQVDILVNHEEKMAKQSEQDNKLKTWKIFEESKIRGIIYNSQNDLLLDLYKNMTREKIDQTFIEDKLNKTIELHNKHRDSLINLGLQILDKEKKYDGIKEEIEKVIQKYTNHEMEM